VVLMGVESNSWVGCLESRYSVSLSLPVLKIEKSPSPALIANLG